MAQKHLTNALNFCKANDLVRNFLLPPHCIITLLQADKWIKMVNFELGNEMWKVNWSAWHELGTKKKSEFPTGIEPMTSQTKPGGRSIHCATWKARSFNWVHVWQAEFLLLFLKRRQYFNHVAKHPVALTVRFHMQYHSTTVVVLIQ